MTNQLYQAIKCGIKTKKKKTITVGEIYSIAEGSKLITPSDFVSQEGNRSFQSAVNQLIEEGLIKKCGKSQNTHFMMPSKYKIANAEESDLKTWKERIVKLIIRPAEKEYYLKNIEDFKNDCEIIEKIMCFLKKDKKDIFEKTVNERSYEIFSDEKLLIGKGLSGEDGRKIMKRLRLTYEHLSCTETLEPFFSFQNHAFQSHKENVIFIIENKDTFWTFKKAFLDQEINAAINLLIYGEGRKILSSFQFIENYVENIEKQQIIYFGDLDAEGINIFIELVDRYPNCHIQPFKKAYQAIYETGKTKQIYKTLKKQNVVESHINRFVECFEDPLRQEIKMLLSQGFYIPQEALSLTEIINGGLKWEK